MKKIAEQLIKQLIKATYPEGLRINIDQDQGTITVFNGDNVLSELSFAQAQTAVNRLFAVDTGQEPDQDEIVEPGAI